MTEIPLKSAGVRLPAAAGALITDNLGRVLLVEPNYKPYWDLPGGVVEEGESPRDAVLRECREELNANVNIGRLLVVDFLDEGRGLRFVFSARLAPGAVIAIDKTELRSWQWCSRGQAGPRLTNAPILSCRIAAARLAQDTGVVFYLENGRGAS